MTKSKDYCMLSWTPKLITTFTKSTWMKKNQSENYKLLDGSFTLSKREKPLSVETQEFWSKLQMINCGSINENHSLSTNPVLTRSITSKTLQNWKFTLQEAELTISSALISNMFLCQRTWWTWIPLFIMAIKK